MGRASLEKLFNPSSIAVVGASASPGKAGYEMLAAITNFPGKIYPINPKEDVILGYKVYQSLSSINNPVDLAILTLPAKLCLQSVKDAAEAGVGAIMIISGGFAETGEQGQQLQNDIVDICRKNNIRLLGPNTSGFAIPPKQLAVSFAPGMDVLSPGPVAIISQSGAINLTMAALAKEINLGVGIAVGIGNGQDVSAASVIDYLADDPSISVITCYLEGVSNGRELYQAVMSATQKKPVVIYTVGKADVGEFAASHTGNLMGSFQLKVSALRQAGAVVVDSTNDMMDAAKLFASVRLTPNPNPGVALLTGQAGPGMIISDYLRDHSVALPELSKRTINQISKLLPPMTFIKNPVDTGRPGESFGEILELVLKDENVDALLTFALHEPAAITPQDIFSKQQQRPTKALIFGTAGNPENVSLTRLKLDAMNIPAFTSPDRAARATAALVDDAKAAFRLSQSRNENTTYVKVDLNEAIGTLDESEAKALLQKIGIGVPQYRVCKDHMEAKKAFEQLPKPVVVKVLCAEIQHKTEVGGVVVNVTNDSELEEALAQIDRIDVRSDVAYLIESMADPGLEIIIGGTNDVSFGPTVLLGLGGTAAEAMEDVSIRVAPLNKADAMEMIKGLRSHLLFEGWRGAPAIDTSAIADTLVRIGDLLAAHPEIKEIDMNPIRVYPSSLLALDALIVT